MNRLLFLLLAISFIFLGCSTSLAQNKHLGLWKGIDGGQVGYVNLDSTGFAFFIIDNDTIGGESFMIEGHEVSIKYEIDYSKPLKTLDFIYYLKKENLEVTRMQGIFKFDENDRLLLCLDFDETERHNTFEEEWTIALEKLNSVND